MNKKNAQEVHPTKKENPNRKERASTSRNYEIKTNTKGLFSNKLGGGQWRGGGGKKGEMSVNKIRHRVPWWGRRRRKGKTF